MIQVIVVVLVLALAGVLAYAAIQPDRFRIERTTLVAAPPERIFPLIDDLRGGFVAWSPYEKKDPAMKRTFSGPAAGKGAAYAWAGDRNIGSGRLEIVESSAPERVVMQLDFLSPFEAHNVAEFTLVPRGGATQVSWAMHGPSTYVSKLIGLFLSMEEMVGKDFEAGLAKLKELAEG